MSEVQTTEEKTPLCPLCGGVTKLKESFRHKTGTHDFFQCIQCSVVYPVVALLGGDASSESEPSL